MALAAPSLRWKVIDIVTTAVLGVVCSLIFVAWNQAGGASYEFLRIIDPGMGGLVTGVWLPGGTLGGYIVRKPGAALFVELTAATVSIALGSRQAVEAIYPGLAQDLGAEIASILVAYRRFNVTIVDAAGVVSFALEWVPELFLSGHLVKGMLYNVIYLACGTASGIILVGLLAWALTNALAKTGTLDRFASDRGARELARFSIHGRSSLRLLPPHFLPGRLGTAG